MTITRAAHAERTIGFDNVRGIAVLIVIVYHLHLVFPWIGDELYNWGPLGVRLFFIVSGYLISQSFERNIAQYGSRDGLRIYTLNRVFRIMPAYFFNLCGLLLLAPFIIEPTVVFSGAFLLQVMGFIGMVGLWVAPDHFLFYPHNNSTLFTLNAAYWTLSIELLWYVIVPWIARRSNRMIIYGMFGSILWLLAIDAWRSAVFLDGPPTPERAQLLDTIREYLVWQIPGQFAFFAFGVLLYRNRAHPWLQWRILHRAHVIAAWIGIIAAIFLVNHTGILVSFTGTSSSLFLNVVLALFALLIFLLIVHTPTPIAPLTWLGVISYSLYLWHYPIARIAQQANVLQYMSPLVFLIVYSLLVVSISTLSYLFIERGGFAMRDWAKARLVPSVPRSLE